MSFCNPPADCKTAPTCRATQHLHLPNPTANSVEYKVLYSCTLFRKQQSAPTQWRCKSAECRILHNITWILSNLAQHYPHIVRLCTAAPADCKTAPTECKDLHNCTCRMQDLAQPDLQTTQLSTAASTECKTRHNCPSRVQNCTTASADCRLCTAAPADC